MRLLGPMGDQGGQCSITRNEGVPGSSPGGGSYRLAGAFQGPWTRLVGEDGKPLERPAAVTRSAGLWAGYEFGEPAVGE